MRKFTISIFLFCIIFILYSFDKNVYNPHPYTLDLSNSSLQYPDIPADNPLTYEGVKLGRLLFYDSILSKNFKQSCGSCHKQELNFSDGLRFSIGTFGDTLDKNSISLINLAWQKNFFWDGRVKTLEHLSSVPLFSKTEMGMTDSLLRVRIKKHKYYPEMFKKAFGTDTISTELVSKAIAQFLRTIIYKPIHLPNEVLNIPPNGVSEQEYTYQYLDSTTPRGIYFRFATMCGSCHNNEVYGMYDGMADNGVGEGKKIKIPALVNILETAPYMHDGRFKNLEEVFLHYNEHIDSLLIKNPELKISNKYATHLIENRITEYDIKNAKLFFQFLKDTSVTKNPEFSNPFHQKEFKWSYYLEQN